MGIIINQYQDPSEPTSKVESQAVFDFVARFLKILTRRCCLKCKGSDDEDEDG